MSTSLEFLFRWNRRGFESGRVNRNGVIGIQIASTRRPVTTVDAAGTFWSRPIADGDRFDRPARPFHVLFHVTERRPDVEEVLRDAANSAGVAVG